MCLRPGAGSGTGQRETADRLLKTQYCGYCMLPPAECQCRLHAVSQLCTQRERQARHGHAGRLPTRVTEHVLLGSLGLKQNIEPELFRLDVLRRRLELQTTHTAPSDCPRPVRHVPGVTRDIAHAHAAREGTSRTEVSLQHKYSLDSALSSLVPNHVTLEEISAFTR